MRSGMIAATSDLTWFFEYGVIAFERSPSGAMWGRARDMQPPTRRDPELARAKRERRLRMKATGEWESPLDELTAVPMHAEQPHARNEPDTGVSERHGKVSRRLAMVALADPQAARALAAAFGHEGAKWSHHESGRNVALFPLTVAGRELIARARRVSSLEMTDAQRLYNEVEVDRLSRLRELRGSKPTPVAMARRRLITMATKEAAELLAAALELWVRTR